MRFVREQFYLAATVQNLKRLVRFLSCKPTPQRAVNRDFSTDTPVNNSYLQFRFDADRICLI